MTDGRSTVIYARDAGIFPVGDGAPQYAQTEVNALLAAHTRDATIVFDAGDYYFRPARRMDLRLSNTNPRADHAVAVLLEGCDGVTLDFSGAHLYFEGQTIPFALLGCRRVTVKNAVIDWKKPLFAEGVVRGFCNEGRDKYIDMFVDPRLYPHRFENGWLTFDCGGGERYALNRWTDVQFVMPQGWVRPGSGDRFSPYRIEKIGDGVYRFFAENCETDVGNVFVLRVADRECPGTFIEDCTDTVLENMTYHCTGGLGILAQFCDTLTYRHVRFAPNRAAGRLAANGHDDGMQVTCCRGKVTVEYCSFAGLMDDPVNVHACSVTVDRLLDDRTAVCRYRHPAAKNFLFWARPGDTVAWIDRIHMNRLATAVVSAYSPQTPDTFFLTFDRPVPAELSAVLARDGEAFALDNISNSADLDCHDNFFGSCRARGLLVSTAGHVEIYRNRFESSGAAILLSGDANGWFESGECRDVQIYDNVFADVCNTSDYEFCKGVISICPVVPGPDASLPFHKNVRVIRNVFEGAGSPALYAYCTRGLIFSGNETPHEKPADAVVTEYCTDVEIR